MGIFDNMSDQTWLLITVAVIGLFFLSAVLKTLLGLAIRLALFWGLAGIVYRAQNDGEITLTDPETLAILGTVGALSFVATTGIVYTIFRDSKMKFVLLPVIGFVATFVTMAVVTQG